MTDIQFLIYSLPIILITIAIHEYAHAKTADLLGDPTPRLSGRLTLNPITHIDPIGFLTLLFLRFGWAKPVPINPYNFAAPKRDLALVSLSGPLSNFAFACFIAIIVKVIPFSDLMLINTLIHYTIWINLALGVFNLIPIPPLDGSKILYLFLPASQADLLASLEQYGFIFLLFILLFPPTSQLIIFLVDFLYRLLI